MRSRRAADTWVEVDDRMQRDYAYQLTEPVGRNFHADFRPELTPKEMLALGVFKAAPDQHQRGRPHADEQRPPLALNDISSITITGCISD